MLSENSVKSNQSLFVQHVSYRKVAQSSLQRLKTTTEKKKQQIKSREENGNQGPGVANTDQKKVLLFSYILASKSLYSSCF